MEEAKESEAGNNCVNEKLFEVYEEGLSFQTICFYQLSR